MSVCKTIRIISNTFSLVQATIIISSCKLWGMSEQQELLFFPRSDIFLLFPNSENFSYPLCRPFRQFNSVPLKVSVRAKCCGKVLWTASVLLFKSTKTCHKKKKMNKIGDAGSNLTTISITKEKTKNLVTSYSFLYLNWFK